MLKGLWICRSCNVKSARSLFSLGSLRTQTLRSLHTPPQGLLNGSNERYALSRKSTAVTHGPLRHERTLNSWSSKFGWGQEDKPNIMTESQEDAAKAAILEKAIKGRQQADLMLRCTFLRFLGVRTFITDPSLVGRHGSR